MSRLLDIINNTSSTIVLECTRGYIYEWSHGNRIISITYYKGKRLPRNCIFLRPNHWKIAAQKYQKNYQKPNYIKNKKLCSISNTRKLVE